MCVGHGVSVDVLTINMQKNATFMGFPCVTRMIFDVLAVAVTYRQGVLRYSQIFCTYSTIVRHGFLGKSVLHNRFRHG